MLFLGHLHPLLVHLPIGGLVLLGFLECLPGFRRSKDSPLNRQWILGFVCVGTIISTAGGYLLARSGGYDSLLLKWHRASGLGVAAASVITLLLCRAERTSGYHISLLSSLLLLAIAGHLGGSITHGRDFLTRDLPEPVRELISHRPTPETPKTSESLPLRQPIFAGVIQPILQQRCVECHGAEKHKGDLRLDTFEGVWRGGQDGSVLKAGRLQNSPLIECMISALDADGHMPPEDQPQPTPEEITLIEWWVNVGAPASLRAIDLQPTQKIQRLIERLSERHEFAK